MNANGEGNVFAQILLLMPNMLLVLESSTTVDKKTGKQFTP